MTAVLLLITLHALADQLRSQADYFRHFDNTRGEQLERIADALDEKEKQPMPGKRFTYKITTEPWKGRRARIRALQGQFGEAAIIDVQGMPGTTRIPTADLRHIPQKSTRPRRKHARATPKSKRRSQPASQARARSTKPRRPRR
jgi:hypothetical protein